MPKIQDWAAEREIELNCDVKRGDYGMGLYAPEDLEEGDLLVRVPARMVVNKANILELSQDPKNCSGALQKFIHLGNSGEYVEDVSSMPAKKCMARFFMAQILAVRRHEQDTTFGDWVRSLPPGKDINLPIAWEEDELRTIEGTSIYDATIAKIKVLKASYERFFSEEQIRNDIATFVKSGSNENPSPHDLVISFFDWLLIEQWISSRSLGVPDAEGYLETVMVPVVDLCNHSGAANCRYDILEEGDVILLADRDIKKGEELFINYGPDKGSGEFLFNYGFIPSDHDTARVLSKFYDPTEEPTRGYLRAPVPGLSDTVMDVEEYESLVEFFPGPNRVQFTTDSWKDDLIAFLAARDQIRVSQDESNPGVFFQDRLIDSLDVYQFLQRADTEFFNKNIVPRGNAMVKPLVNEALDEMRSTSSSVHHRLYDLEALLLERLLSIL